MRAAWLGCGMQLAGERFFWRGAPQHYREQLQLGLLQHLLAASDLGSGEKLTSDMCAGRMQASRSGSAAGVRAVARQPASQFKWHRQQGRPSGYGV